MTDRERSMNFNLRLVQHLLAHPVTTRSQEVALAGTLAAIATDTAEHPMSLREACRELLPHRIAPPARKRAARAVRKAYDTRLAELVAMPSDELLALARSQVEHLTPVTIAA